MWVMVVTCIAVSGCPSKDYMSRSFETEAKCIAFRDSVATLFFDEKRFKMECQPVSGGGGSGSGH
jgi:hypothetical protein